MKIWRYMDLAKFISLLSEKAIFFAAQNHFFDPFEGHLSKSHYDILDNQRNIWKNTQIQDLIEKFPGIIEKPQFAQIVEAMEKMPSTAELSEITKKKFGVSCWHLNDYENEALWKIYTNQNQGIAIETTIEKLEKSLTYHQDIIFDKVRYEDYSTALIEKGHKHYSGFIKRKAFEYEKEFRAMVLLDEVNFGEGCFIPVDLDMLIEKIHVSPLVPKYFLESVRFLCKNDLSFLQDRIVQSSLYDKPHL